LGRESALAFVEATAAQAKLRGDEVGVGAFFTVHDLVAVLARYVVDDASRTELTRLAAWLDRPIPLGTCRMVIVAGVELRASIARVAPSGMRRTARAPDAAMLN
jgi:hypothetical protein